MPVLTSHSRKYRIQQRKRSRSYSVNTVTDHKFTRDACQSQTFEPHLLMAVNSPYGHPCVFIPLSDQRSILIQSDVTERCFVPDSQFSLNIHINNTSKTRRARTVEPLCLFIVLLPPFFHVRLPLPFLSFYVIIFLLVQF